MIQLDTVLTKRLPWVTYLAESIPCEGFHYNRMPMRATHWWGPGRKNPPTGVEPYRCKNRAYWRFEAATDSMATSGTYCWSHLWSIGLWDMGEQERLEEWLKQEGLWRNED